MQINTDTHNSGFTLDSEELPSNSGRSYPAGNMAHRPGHKGGYVPEAPVDRFR